MFFIAAAPSENGLIKMNGKLAEVKKEMLFLFSCLMSPGTPSWQYQLFHCQ